MYMIIMLSRRDSVHSSIGIGLVTVLIVGLSFLGCQGLGSYFGIPNNNLNNNIPFLLLGLGVDDAFVITGEYMRVALKYPKAGPVEHVAQAARHGGVSILITSVTDGLAFLVGSATVLPALSWFCTFAGLGVIICFVLQVTLCLPALAVNAKRAAENRYDFLCCFKAKEDHPIDEEKGCCFCCKCKSGKLEVFLKTWTTFNVSKVGRVVVLAFFAILFGLGVAGSTMIYKDFKLEWFFPDDSYVNQFFQLNTKYFASGAPVTVYTREMDYFKAQPALRQLHSYLNSSKYVDLNEPIDDWHYTFLESIRTGNSPYKPPQFNGEFPAGTEANYWKALHQWVTGGGGARYRGRIKWVDPQCENGTMIGTARRWDSCNPQLGLSAARFGCTLKLEFTDKGQTRFDTMTAMRSEVATIMKAHGGSRNFPYSFQFLYWEEVGIIDAELIRNLAICGAVVLSIIGLMIPHPRIAVWVALSIVLSVIDLIGFMYWWGVTISGVSTVYILISVGLAVDYSAHIAHMFVVSTGTPQERALKAMDRIGPSVFNGIISTLLAVIIIGFSKSYVFRVFFKALFLTVVFGGIHGLVFLPTILSMFGGSKEPGQHSPRDVNPVKSSAIADSDSGVEMSNVKPSVNDDNV
jgi:predicted RND superfamily exporter protein